MNWVPKNRVYSFRKSEEGAVAIIFALTATMAMGIIGAAIDFGLAFNERMKLQASVDAAAMAGARSIALNIGVPETVATGTFNANYTLAAGSVPAVSVNGSRVDVSAAVSMKTHLLQLAGIPALNISATAAAEPAFEEVTTPPTGGGDVCILLLDSFKQNSLDVNSGSTFVSAPTCEVHVKSTRSQAAQVHTNAHFDVARACVDGGIDTSNGSGQGVIGPLEESCDTASDSIAGTLPVPSIGACTPSRNLKNNTEYMTPGTYCGTWAFKGGVKTISLAPGLYILNNAVWDFGADIIGTDVTFYFADSSSFFNFKGQGSIAIQAPTSGTYNGILMYEPPNMTPLTSKKINGGQNAVIKGLIYLPSRDMEWNGNSGVDADSVTMVFNSLWLSGNTTWRFAPHDYHGIQAPGSGGGTTQVMSSIKLLTN